MINGVKVFESEACHAMAVFENNGNEAMTIDRDVFELAARSDIQGTEVGSV